MKVPITFFLLILATLPFSEAFPQLSCSAGRYLNPVFSCVQVDTPVVYGVGRVNWRSELLCNGPTNGVLPPYNSLRPLRADVYQPCNDPDSQRAFLLYIHGGAFAVGNKADASSVAFCDSMARRGYVVASIQYRLSMCGGNILVELNQINRGDYEITRAAYRAIQDAKAAVRFFKANASTYGIDTSMFFAAGVSAGAITTLGLAYMDQPSEKFPDANALPGGGSWLGNLLYPDLGPIEGEGGNPSFSSKVKAVIPVAGSAIELNYLNGAYDPPALLIHGNADLTVPYDTGCFFQDLLSGGIVTNCIQNYGSRAIKRYADSLGMCVELLTFQNTGHGFSASQIDTVLAEGSRFLHGFICESPEADVRATRVERCIGASAELAVLDSSQGNSYQWYKGDSLLAGADSAQLRFGAIGPGDYGNYYCRLQGKNCAYTFSDSIQLVSALPTPSAIVATGPLAFCEGDSVALFGSSGPGLQHQWLMNGIPINGVHGQRYAVGQSGSYAVILNDSKGCSDTSWSLPVQVFPNPPKPVISAGGARIFCPGDSLQLTSSMSGGNLWSTGASNTSIQVFNPGSYWLSVSDSNGCKARSDSLTIDWQEVATADFSWSLSGDTAWFANHSQGATTFLWNFGDGQSDNSVDPRHVFTQSGTYAVRLIALDSCGNDTSVQNLQIILTGLSSLVEFQNLQLYPNPADHILHIQITGESLITGIRLTDALGRKVFALSGLHSKAYELDRRGILAGIYWVEVYFQGGKLSRKAIFR